MGRKVLVALGGNAILSEDPSASAQMKAIEETTEYLIELVKQGYQLIVSHGNGPQVGNLLLQQKCADSDSNPAMPLDTCVAMTQGSIGYWLQNAMSKALKSNNIDKKVVSVVTQVLVDKEDPAFDNLTKPVGPFLTKEEAQAANQLTGDQFVEDAGRGYRKVVASPKPLDIVEADVIKVIIEQDVITISAGGGGIPVIETATGYQGVEAVIDKDFASAKLAELVGVDFLLILTGVDNVYINYNQPNQEKLEHVSVDQMKEWMSQNQFAAGSMLPKVEAAIQFVENQPDGKAVITSLANIKSFFEGGSATIITK